MIPIWLVMLMVTSSGVANKGIVMLTYSDANMDGMMHYCLDTHYYFHCNVMQSSALVWKVSGVQVVAITPSDRVTDTFPQQYNVMLHNIALGNTETETNFTSSMWFRPSDFDAESVTCESFEDSSTILLISGDVVEPSNIDAIARYDSRDDSTTIICYWNYDGDREKLLHFETQINGNMENGTEFLGETDIHRSDTTTVNESVSHKLSGSIFFRVAAIGHCNPKRALPHTFTVELIPSNYNTASTEIIVPVPTLTTEVNPVSSCTREDRTVAHTSSKDDSVTPILIGLGILLMGAGVTIFALALILWRKSSQLKEAKKAFGNVKK